MSTLSSAEQKLLSIVKDSSLKTSLGLIREAMEKIWSPEIRVIRGYTDHGVKHCERLAENAVKLLKANKQSS